MWLPRLGDVEATAMLLLSFSLAPLALFLGTFGTFPLVSVALCLSSLEFVLCFHGWLVLHEAF